MLGDFRLKVFQTVAQKRNFSKAAKVLGISQPAVSMHISELEKIIDSPLFIRQKGIVTLTDKGRILLDYSSKILYLYECVNQRLIPDNTKYNRSLRIGYPSEIKFILTPIIFNLQSLYPKLEIVLRDDNTEDIVNLLKEGLIDIAILDIKDKASLFENNIVSKPFYSITNSSSGNKLKEYYLYYILENFRDNPSISLFLLNCSTLN
ncbi:MAG: LysR family transcriptional regulator [Bacteroidales bacterium]